MSSQFTLQQLKYVFDRLGEFFHMKLFFAYAFTFFAWIFDGSVEIIATIFILLALDSLTGISIALINKYKQIKGTYSGPPDAVFSSRGLVRGPLKFTVYFIFILVSRLVDKHISLPFASPMIDAFLVTTEAYSIFENFAKLGFSTPTALIDKLKGFATKKSE